MLITVLLEEGGFSLTFASSSSPPPPPLVSPECRSKGNFPFWWTTLEVTNQSAGNRIPDMFVEGNALEICHFSVPEVVWGPVQTLNISSSSEVIQVKGFNADYKRPNVLLSGRE